MTAWTEERIEQLREFWIKGLSCSQIAKEMGHVSRNAVIGKASRLGLDARRPRFNAQRATLTKIREKYPQRRRTISFERVDSEPFVPKVALLPEPPLNLSLLDLAFGQCRYPVTDDTPFFFCGHPQGRDSSYCPAHHAICCPPKRTLNITDAERERRRSWAWRLNGTHGHTPFPPKIFSEAAE